MIFYNLLYNLVYNVLKVKFKMKRLIVLSLFFSLFTFTSAQAHEGAHYGNTGKQGFVKHGLVKVANDNKQLKTIKLDVDKMTCNMCPITVKKALRKLDGVVKAKAKYEGDGIGWAEVTYDPSKISPEDITSATEMAGYPSRLADN